VDKSPDAFRTISEVATELEVPQHVLRFWESRFKDIRPMKRGGGRRYYRPDDVELLRGIRHLLYGEGYTIRGVQRILREQGGKFVQAVWRPGAPQPAHGPADEGDYETDTPETRKQGADEVERGRGLLGLLPSLLGDDEARGPPSSRQESRPETRQGTRQEPRLPPETMSAPAAAPRPISRDNQRKLQSALQELAECRKLIDAALRDSA
jgi:DNA-binding transcriptional MerR regulator